MAPFGQGVATPMLLNRKLQPSDSKREQNYVP